MELLKQLIGIVIIAAVIAGLAGLWAWASNKNAKSRAASQKSESAQEKPGGCSMNCGCCAMNCGSEKKDS